MRKKRAPGAEGIPIREAGRRGGEATKERHGPEHFRRAGKKGGKAAAKQHGPDFYSKMGKCVC